jgi:predicted O-methyltransferase YrrM
VTLPEHTLVVVDVQRFVSEVPRAFDSFPDGTARDPRFGEVLEAVPGLAAVNNLALLNVAASLIEPGESYVEAGTFKGTSLISAMLGNEGDFVAIDNFSMGDGSPELVRQNLARFGLEGATILEGDTADVLQRGDLAGRRIGVFYYDAAHSYEAHLEGLRLVEPYLAERALLIVDDSDWEQVGRATRDYLAGQPRARMLFDVKGDQHGQPDWWKGVHVLGWSAEPEAPAEG